MKDTMGNTHSDVLMGYEIDGASETYDIGGQYNKLTGTIFVREDDKGKENAAGIRIYGDGVLLYENMNITSNTKPTAIDVNISSVVDLKIVLYCGGGNWMSGYDMYPVISGITLQKTR